MVSLEKDYRNWAYEPMAITICTDYLDEDAMNTLIQQYTDTTEDCDPDSYDIYRRFFAAIGLMNADNIHSIREFANIDLVMNFTGEDLRIIATQVR